MANRWMTRGMLGGAVLVGVVGLFRAGMWWAGGPSVASANLEWKKPAPAVSIAKKSAPATAAGALIKTKPASTSAKTALAENKSARVTSATKPAAANALSLNELLRQTAPAVAVVQVRDSSLRPRGQGIGFFVSSDGLFVTNDHIVSGTTFASVQTADGRALFVEGILARDEQADLALLKVRTVTKDYLRVSTASSPLVAGKVYTVSLSGSHSKITEGQIGSMDVEKGFHLFRSHAVVSESTSGSPILGADGTVIGATSVIVADGDARSYTVGADRIRALLAHRRPGTAMASSAGGMLTASDAMAFAKTFMALDRGDLKAASNTLRSLRERQGKNPLYWYMDGALHSMLNNLDLAADSYREAISLKPDLAIAHESLANVLSNQGKLREAIKEYRALARCDPSNWLAYQNAGIASSMLGENEKAVAYFDYAIALEPKRAHLHRYRGQALADLGRNIDAFAAFRNALRLDPNDPTTYASIGALHLKLGHAAEAMIALKRSLSLDRTNPTAYLTYGDAAFAIKDLVTARAAWQNAIRFDARNGPVAKKAAEKLKYAGDVAGGYGDR